MTDEELIQIAAILTAGMLKPTDPINAADAKRAVEGFGHVADALRNIYGNLSAQERIGKARDALTDQG